MSTVKFPVDQSSWSQEERDMAAALNKVNTWEGKTNFYGESDIQGCVDYFTEDAISVAAGHPAMRGAAEIRAWHDRRVTGYKMDCVSEIETCDIVGDIAVTTGIFRISRTPQDGVPGVEHAGRWLTVAKRVNGEWKTWRDMDTPSPDAEIFYKVPVDVALGWVRAPMA